MKKTILSLALALVAFAVSGTTVLLRPNQRLVGYYTSDDIDNSLSFTSAPGKMQAGAYLVPNDEVQQQKARWWVCALPSAAMVIDVSRGL